MQVIQNSLIEGREISSFKRDIFENTNPWKYKYKFLRPNKLATPFYFLCAYETL
jgi:hypothetical protein